MLSRFLVSISKKIGVLVVITLLSLLGGVFFTSMEFNGQALAATESISCPPVVPGKIHRFVEGEDSCVTPLSDAEIEKLNDPFTKNILRAGVFPMRAKEITQAIADKLGYQPTVYVVGEGSQIPLTVVSKEFTRGLRYDVSWGPTENDPKMFLSQLSPATRETKELSLIEMMSFDEQSKEYNYYLLTYQTGESYDSPFVWAWTGSSSMAHKPQTIGNGCFRCHHNGVPIMREIELPWSNWQSQRATIASTFLPPEIANETFFLQRRGAEVYENVIRSQFQKFYTNWLKENIRKDGSNIYVSDVPEMLRHVITNTTVNFKSSDVQSDAENTSPPNGDITGVPPNDTFLADTLLQTTLKLDYPTLSVKLPRNKYDAYLKEHNYNLIGTKGFYRTSEEAYRKPGSTYFAFYLPQLAAEDIYVTQKLLQSKIVNDKFVASVLMVDFKNPLFSQKRASLQKYAKEITTGKLVAGVSSIPTEFAAKIKATGATACQVGNFDACSAEEQFLYTWELPNDQWKQVTANQIKGYVDSIANLPEDQKLDYLMRWSVKQRDRFAAAPLFCNFYESRLLFPDNDLSEDPECPAYTASN